MSEEDKETAEGYLYVSSDWPWPRDRETAIAERRLPESWLEADDKRDRDVVRPSLAPHVPMPVTVDAFGHENGTGETVEAAFISGPFRFCLRCGVSYEQVRGSDFAKLATLTQEGRSSATTLTSMSIVRSLLAVPDDALDDDARKLLTFVDNRQDAALQAGHFNDYVEVTLVRGALYRAARDAVKGGRRACATPRSPAPSPRRWACDRRSTRSIPARTTTWRLSPAGRCAGRSSSGSTWTWTGAGGSPCRTWRAPACWRSATSG